MDETNWDTRKEPEQVVIQGKVKTAYELYIKTGDPFFSD